LLEFLAVRDRVQSTDYRPTPADAETARHAYTSLEQGLTADGLDLPSLAGDRLTGDSEQPIPAAGSSGSSIRGRNKFFLPATIGAVIILGIVVGFVLFGRSLGGRTPKDIQRAVDLYASGQRLQAREHFARAATNHPERALPHIYLGRIAREEGDWATAGRELARAAELEPANGVAHRELGAYFLARGQFDAARRSYVRAIARDTSDRPAKGYLGCALIRLGRVQEGMQWIARAGTGDWNNCAPMPQPGGPRAAPYPSPPSAPS
ncbi:MAG: tetratricopeptide repeat protein, partial [Gemmatimonadaceae bacterium]